MRDFAGRCAQKTTFVIRGNLTWGAGGKILTVSAAVPYYRPPSPAKGVAVFTLVSPTVQIPPLSKGNLLGLNFDDVFLHIYHNKRAENQGRWRLARNAGTAAKLRSAAAHWLRHTGRVCARRCAA